jgi:hypothetical protein
MQRIRLPDGKHETTVSMQNQHQKISYDMSCDHKNGIVTITAKRAPYWTVIVPLSNCAFVHLGNGKNTTKLATKEPIKPADEAPKMPVVRNSRPRVRVKG